MNSALPQARRKRAGRTPLRVDRVRALRILWLWAGGAVLVFALSSIGLGFAVRSDVACGSCHEMEPYATAHQASDHAGIACSTCHARDGVAGLLADGVRAARWVLRTPSVEAPSAAWASDAACMECHDATFQETIVARGIRVRHSDFQGEPCGTCHAGRAHELEGRGYLAPQMEYCMECHRSTSTEISTCEVCHPPDAASERSPGWSTWRVAHGGQWEQTHGMADLDECRSCHAPQYCVGCHGTAMPHATDWPRTHGRESVASGADSCATCHEPDWCVACHGIEMPHDDAFLPQHGPIAQSTDSAVCEQCHAPAACQACHIASSHPNLPTVGMGGHDGEVTP